MTDRLLEELQCETVIKIPFLNGLLDIKESIVVTWIIMAVIVALCIIFVRNLKVENPGKGQLLLESAIRISSKMSWVRKTENIFHTY